MTEALRNTMRLISARLRLVMTDEQIEFASDFTKPVISFSDPGTGKSMATVAGLITAQTVHGVAGVKINAMSFTRAATAELASRYRVACKQCGISPTVQFNTFHSICYSIVRERYPNMRILERRDLEADLQVLAQFMEQYGCAAADMFHVRAVMNAVNHLNSALVYDEENVRRAYMFRKLGISVELFQNLRRELLLFGSASNAIARGDIPTYALYVLCRFPEVQRKYKEKYRIMVVDEFQDLSILHLKILSMVTYNLVAIGDMKQQIYGFNGAGERIVEEYLKIYKDAKIQCLTQSFRCKDEIAAYATNLIRSNDPAVKTFKGTSMGGKVNVLRASDFDLKSIVGDIASEQQKIGKEEYRDSMFLFRNNASAIPLAEELYKQRVPFRMPRLLPIYEMPIFKEVCTLAEAARNPYDKEKVFYALKLFPEFKRYPQSRNPLLMAMAASGCSLFDVMYRFKEQSSMDMMETLRQVASYVSTKVSAGRVFNCLLKVYEQYVIEGKWWKLQYPKEYYFSLIAPIVNNKTYAQMYQEEANKLKFTKECIDASYGVRCFTIHVAKGLEANDVYLLDADKGVFPNAKALQGYIEEGCEYEAAKEVRSERNLLYVAVTRAKDTVTICYHDDLTELVDSPLNNCYSELDSVYDAQGMDFDDVGAFMSLLHLGDGGGQGEQAEELMLAEL